MKNPFRKIIRHVFPGSCPSGCQAATSKSPQSMDASPYRAYVMNTGTSTFLLIYFFTCFLFHFIVLKWETNKKHSSAKSKKGRTFAERELGRVKVQYPTPTTVHIEKTLRRLARAVIEFGLHLSSFCTSAANFFKIVPVCLPISRNLTSTTTQLISLLAWCIPF